VFPVRVREKSSFISSSGIVSSKRSLHKLGVDDPTVIGDDLECGSLVAAIGGIGSGSVGDIDTGLVAHSPGDLPVCGL
jgi:hypothetical protein